MNTLSFSKLSAIVFALAVNSAMIGAVAVLFATRVHAGALGFLA